MYEERGSVWRKWDLHVHTPASIIQHYGGDQEDVWEKYISDLEDLPEEYSVLGINDYLFIDGYERLVKEKEENGRLQNIDLLLPVVEFRIEKFAGVEFGPLKRINLHVIFSNEVTVDTIKSQFLNTLEQSYKIEGGKEWHRAITRESLSELGESLKEGIPPEKLKNYSGDLAEGFNNLNLKEEQILKSLKKDCFEEKYLTAVGKTEWAELKWSKSSIATKKDIINKADLVFASSSTIKSFNSSKKSLREQKVNDLLLDCSDAHYFSDSENKDRIGNSFTWIKADPDFLGLKQIINEPNNRIYIGEEPKKFKSVRSNSTKYISKISFEKNKNSTESEIWFEKTDPLELNHDLIAIIGNKGMGKSALADIIALTSNSKRDEQDFSFLNTQKFKHRKNNKAKHFKATTTWHDGSEIERQLDKTVDAQDVELVHYLPQKYIEKICNEIGVQDESEFDKQLEKVIFSHVPESDRLGFNTLGELIEYKTNEINERINSISNQLDSVNKEIIKLKHKLSDEYKEGLQNDLKAKRKELEALKKNPPKKVPEPETSEEIQETIEIINLKIKKVRKRIVELEKKEKKQKKDLKNVTGDISSAEKAIEKIKNFEKDYGTLTSELSGLLEDFDVDVNELISLDIDYEKLELKKDELDSRRDEINDHLSAEAKDSIVRNLKANKLYLNWLKEKLNQPNQKYQKYLTEKKEWKDNKDEIIGDEETQDTIKYLEKRLDLVKQIPKKLKEKRKERKQISIEIYKELDKLKSIYKNIYKPVLKYIDDLGINSNKFSINFDVKITSQNFKSKFLEMINKNVSGSYYGEENANTLISEIRDKYDFDFAKDLENFLEELVNSIETNLQKDEPINVANQLRKGIEEKDLYNFIFGLSYLNPKYELKMGKKEIGQLSPGERGTLLLIFYLLVDQDDRPIIIDQPEENLDNETVYETLVPCIKKAKNKRQIIIVTHNPNLAVVCDAEQIISANIDKENGNDVSYTTGAIENPKINKEILDVLEGTRPAFDNRDAKYIA